MNEIIIYKTKDKKTQIEVNFENETVWLTQQHMESLFGQTKQNISLNINNSIKEKELNMKSTVKESLTTAADGKRYQTKYYNFDVIISVGYRVKSIRGTQFRQWATQRLKDYLIEGVAINEKRLAQKNKEIKVLHDGIRILSRAIEEHANNNENYAWLHQFSVGLQLLDDYDHESLDTNGNHTLKAEYPTLIEFMELVDKMKMDFKSDIFGKEKDDGFKSAISVIQQQFDKKDIYLSIEEKASMLLYLIVKNHAFVDGNKRIAAACFLLFLNRNKLLYNEQGQTIISNEALASLTLFVAASKADEMKTVKQLLISILNRKMK
jgi:prophage maintenance system killer protein